MDKGQLLIANLTIGADHFFDDVVGKDHLKRVQIQWLRHGILGLGGGVLLDSRNGQHYDTAGSLHPPRWWFIASSPRTGSTLLARALWDTGKVGAPKEYLNPTQIRDWEVRLGSVPSRWRHRLLTQTTVPLAGRGVWPAARRRAFLDRIATRRAGPTGWVGLKVHHHHYRRWFGDALPAPPLRPQRWVRIRREDKLAQAVSWDRALQTRAWADHQNPRHPPIYRRSRLVRALERIEAAEAFWRAVLADEPRLEITYEDLAHDLTGQVNRVLAWLECPPVSTTTPSLTPQADEISAAWAARFRAGR